VKDACFSDHEVLGSERFVRTLKILKPGQKGTKELLTRYGTSLLCVRYRYDETTGERVKTVELIVRRYSRDCARARPPVRQVASRIRHPVASGALDKGAVDEAHTRQGHAIGQLRPSPYPRVPRRASSCASCRTAHSIRAGSHAR